jgi:hypothetical protein
MLNSQLKCIALIALIDSFFVPAVTAKRKSSDSNVYLTVEEAKHIGAPFVPRPIASAFNRTKYSTSADAKLNRFDLHHNLVYNYCSEMKKKSCSWRDYYAMLDVLRYPYNHLFDPGAINLMPIDEIFQNPLPRKLKRSKNPEECDTITKPTAKDFLKLVKASHPVIIKGVASEWPAVTKWTLQHLKMSWSEKKVKRRKLFRAYLSTCT